MKLPVVWREAFEELMRRKLRTLLTLLGLIFGVGSIVAMQAVGEGSRREALRLVEGLGLNNIVVESREQDEETLREQRARSLGLSLTDARVALAVTPAAKKFAAEKAVKVHSVFNGECNPCIDQAQAQTARTLFAKGFFILLTALYHNIIQAQAFNETQCFSTTTFAHCLHGNNRTNAENQTQ